ncbi:protein-(glutamine-N5) methyltransferase, release factor-specific [Xanthomonas translucens pv. arrhenatheri]|uniref:Release factor glutamine methyltransferase n=1 Tax=Xanthomonas graminis pv. arrhenatheri LMG 727 TaxID=1195923 RepID=A0A0K3A3F2_9XANT|nr:peptide chain release factor N(5)-glutamine methyltransferase [Xanthomonas translucens]OAX66009.1 protein-(glutamine-N5) methyltransferase, release factor-specific [Xanthomonas translucens pv. arrhenatheri]UKE76935.1 peptide chain release factor N(5)-glutamine methyltransferase [Xanthomonas translucens pv. arrhenatheri]CTP90974.1 Release factor glutamine methyltransferase [Xanthomonas translucens pv. arrhenatheri LMG 727]
MNAPTPESLLRAACVQIDRADAEALLIHALRRDRAWLFAHARDPLPVDAAERFDVLLARRAQGEPVAYLTGRRGFWTLNLAVGPATLIPRADTERLVELALERLDAAPGRRVADLGTGSGAIALALASERPQAQVLATDLSEAALAVAQANARTHGLHNVAFAHGPWLAPLAGQRFDLIASNPPYIAAGDPHLAQGDLRYEPASALASGADGLDDIRVIVAGASAHLQPGGWLLLEHGWEQGAAVRALLADAGFDAVATHQDLEARDRVTLGCWPAG